MSDFEISTIKVTAGITLISLLSRILGFVREMMIAEMFGATMITDAYRMAALIPSMLFSAIAGAMGVTLIPVLSGYVHGKNTASTNRFVNNVLNISLLVSVVVMIGGIVAAEQIVEIVAPGFSDEAAAITVRLIRIMFPIVAYNVVAVVATGYLHIHNKFLLPALSMLLFNLVILTQLYWFGGFGVDGLAFATTIGMIIQGFVQIPLMFKTGYRYQFVLDHKCEGLKKVFMLMMPVLMGSAISQIFGTINQVIASGLPAGSIAALDFGGRINGMINSLFVISIATVLYPTMARMAFAKQTDKLKKITGTGIRIVSFGTMPMMVGLMLLSHPIVKLLFERGAFDERATFMTAQALFFFGFAIVPNAVNAILSRAFFSLQDTKTPVIIGLLSIGVNVMLNLILVRFMAHAGLALASGITSAFSVALTLILFRRKMGILGGRLMAKSFVKHVVCASIMGIFVFLTNTFALTLLEGETVVIQIMRLMSSVSVGAAIYLLTAYVLKVEEMRMAIGILKKIDLRKFS